MDGYRIAEICDETLAGMCALGVALFLVAGIGASLYHVRLYYRFNRRSFFKWRAARMEERCK
jgi:hypothetical protein